MSLTNYEASAMLRRSTALIVIAFASITTVANKTISAQDSTHSSAVTTARSDTLSSVAGLRNPAAAAALGAVIPGAGLAYAGHWGRAAGTYFGTVGSIGLGSLLMVADRCTFSFDSGCNPGRVWPQRALGVGLIAVGLGTWAYGAIDAFRIIERDNADELSDRNRTLGSVSPIIGVSDGRGVWMVGVHATW